MLKLFTSHHIASRCKNRSSHKLAHRAFFSTLTDSKLTNTVSTKPCLDDCQTVVALPLLRKPLIPGFYMPLYVKDPKVLAALQESKSGQSPYAGAFLLKDDIYASTASSSSSFETVNILDKLKGKELLHKIHQVGTLAQILSIQGEQVILIGRKRLQITEMVTGDPLTVKTHHIIDKLYDKDDKVIIKATYFEDIGDSNYQKLAKFLLQKRRRKFTGFGAGIFEAIDVFHQKLTGSGDGIFKATDFNYKKLADFGVGISGANKHKIQEVLEELDVRKRLDLVKKQVEINKIQVFHASIFPVTHATRFFFVDDILLFTADKFRERVKVKLMMDKIPKHVVKVMEEKFEKLDRAEKDSSSTDSIYNYLDWLTALPWGECSNDNFDVLRAEEILDEDHYGLRDVKERILEFVAVGTLTGNSEGKIICLSGPPGVGKTSIARSVARALGRKFFRLAVGGLSDSSHIKGDRGLYVGAAPGQMVQCLKEVRTENPLVLLDEIDKIGQHSSKDPEGALLELLDPEQNAHFLDYFLDVPIDLSKVLFVCTANDINRIPDPLLDRMEVIELAGYTADEKMHIARDYLVKNVQKKCGIKPELVDVSEATLLSLIENYCREAGVRNLQKQIEKIFRKIALKLVRQQASAKAAMTDLKSSETAAEGSIELTNEYLRLADVLKVLGYALGGGPTSNKSRAVAEKLTIDEANLADYLGKPGCITLNFLNYFSLSLSLLMMKPFTSHHMPLAIRVGSTPANRSLLLLKAWSQQTLWNRSSHELAPRAFFSTLTNSKRTVSCSATGSAENVKKKRLSDTFRKRIEPIKEKIPKHVLEVIEEELANLDKNENDHDIYSYLDWLTALPWGKCSDENFDVIRAEKILDEDHYGLRDVKERILEFIAVGTLTGNSEGRKIICLSGPPGVGKTSIARSVARALGRKFFRLALGGLSDSSEIKVYILLHEKNNRRVYATPKPGKMVQCLRIVGTENPLVLLDEIDKLGKSSRDPEGALLELLDPEQNAHFLDYFLDVPIDLSKVLFVCTANDIDRIPDPLLDRMEVIKLAGYTADEKMHIARDYLVKTVRRTCGIKLEQVDVSYGALLFLIENYCREAGVRNLQKQIEKIFRKIALKIVRQQASAKATMADFKSSAEGSIEMLHEYLRLQELEYAHGGGPMSEKSRAVAEKFTIDASNLADYLGKPVFEREKLYEQTPVGVVMGLAWTSMGGSTFYIETTFVEEGKGGLHVTGHLGRVMKESAEIAHTVARRIMFEKEPDNLFFANSKLHLHVPEGATPKDGPSAGCTMITSLLSLALKKPVRKDLAMTGEVTLTGRILPIGGLKEKTMAARRSQVKVIIFPEANRRDFEDLEESIKEGLDVHFVEEYEQIFELAFSYDH
ncbi:unnamed protein product [Eruca vesicaria subsp. sativa]|uniref:Lon protease homolog n=1 Tax=Eruca vesicaria subsp. sativa TaxID=29727 RepID=A0ABC8IUT5_ERUVS|nr:unnamed protein product [Eruca vesicaria subsp. sativa]